MSRFLYLISPGKINQSFYKDLDEVLSSRKVKYFQIRFKKYSRSKILNISKQVKKITKKYKVKLISSGGTYKKIKSLGYNCVEISDYTGFQEILDGRVKTLHPKIYSGILFKRNKNTHKKTLKKLNFEGIDLVIANFYPFEKTLNQTKKHQKIYRYDHLPF